MKEKEETTCM
jgi:hypothetical protein